MRGEDGCDFNPLQCCERLLRVDASGFQSSQSSAKRTGHGRMVGVQLGGATATFAVISFRQVCELEINGECLGELVGVFDGKVGNDGAGLRHEIFVIFLLRLAMLDKKAAEMLDDVQQGFAGLLHENAAQQNSQANEHRAGGEVLWRSPRSRR